MAKQKKGRKAPEKAEEQAGAKAGGGLRELLRVPAGEVDLTTYDTRATAGFSGTKDDLVPSRPVWTSAHSGSSVSRSR